MGLFSNNEAEILRKRNLKELEDKRVRFAEMLAARGFQPEECLYVQQNGGFAAVARQGSELFLLTGPAPRRISPSGPQAAPAPMWRTC